MKTFFNNVPTSISIPLLLVAFFALFAVISFFVELVVFYFSYPLRGNALADIINEYSESPGSEQLQPIFAIANVTTFTLMAGLLLYLPIHSWKSGLVILGVNVIAFIKCTLKWLVILIIYSIFLSIFLSVFNISPGPGKSSEETELFSHIGSTDRWILLLLSINVLVVMPIVEEYLFRGFLFGSLRAHYGPALSTLITSLMFMFAHVFNPGIEAYYLLLIFFDSIFLCLAREKTGNIYIPCVLHIIMNLWVMT